VWAHVRWLSPHSLAGSTNRNLEEARVARATATTATAGQRATTPTTTISSGPSSSELSSDLESLGSLESMGGGNK